MRQQRQVASSTTVEPSPTTCYQPPRSARPRVSWRRRPCDGDAHKLGIPIWGADFFVHDVSSGSPTPVVWQSWFGETNPYTDEARGGGFVSGRDAGDELLGDQLDDRLEGRHHCDDPVVHRSVSSSRSAGRISASRGAGRVSADRAACNPLTRLPVSLEHRSPIDISEPRRQYKGQSVAVGRRWCRRGVGEAILATPGSPLSPTYGRDEVKWAQMTHDQRLDRKHTISDAEADRMEQCRRRQIERTVRRR